MAKDNAGANGLVRQFWDKYIILLNKQGVKPNQQRWVVRRVEAYIAHYTNEKLATHTSQHVTEYFHVIGRQKRLKDWQFAQTIDAIQTLCYTDTLSSNWLFAVMSRPARRARHLMRCNKRSAISRVFSGPGDHGDYRRYLADRFKL